VIRAYDLLARKRAGAALTAADIQAVARGAADGSWGDAELAAFLMAAAIRGLDSEETGALTVAMLESGERWNVAAEVPTVADKHSTGGVGDNVSLILVPLLASCGVPVAMLTGRALGHSGGTADKLEGIPGLRLDIDREQCLRLLGDVGAAVGIATAGIAPADRRLYALRDRTATVESLPLIVASILSKKLALGAAAVVFDVKTGSGAFMRERDSAEALARRLVEICRHLGTPASALLTDMNQPLGRWSGHDCEVREALEVLEGGGPPDLRAVTVALAAEAARLVGAGDSADRTALGRALADGSARERFDRWALAQGADPGWVRAPRFELAPVEIPVLAESSGYVAEIDVRRLGLILGAAGWDEGAGGLDRGVSLRTVARLGDRVEKGQELCRLYVRAPRPDDAATARACFRLVDSPPPAPALIEALAI
jgi:pyrimidine-nucleoside phosphorylase